MKVLDLQCAFGHSFEGWFASEQDYVAQCAAAQVQCPLCGDPTITKKLSAPRLNLSAKRAEPSEPAETSAQTGTAVAGGSSGTGFSATPPFANDVTLPALQDPALAAAWMAMARQVVANTTDVGDQFAQEARKMHYGEAEERSIRGKATLQETRDLVEEGIAVMPFAMPESMKKTLQ